MSTRKQLITICEGAVMVAAAYALGLLKIPLGFVLGAFGGSIDFAMVPIVIYALRRGLGWGLGAGLIYGTAEFFFAGGAAVNWQSMLLDYSLAFMAVGFAGLGTGSGEKGYYWAPFVGCAARFIVHFISGITIYAQFMPEEFLGLTMTSPTVYSILFNGTYMLPNTVITVIACLLLKKPMQKVPR